VSDDFVHCLVRERRTQPSRSGKVDYSYHDVAAIVLSRCGQSSVTSVQSPVTEQWNPGIGASGGRHACDGYNFHNRRDRLSSYFICDILL